MQISLCNSVLNCLSTVWLIILWSVVRQSVCMGREEIVWIGLGADELVCQLCAVSFDPEALWNCPGSSGIVSGTAAVLPSLWYDAAVSVASLTFGLRRCELLGYCTSSGKPPTVGWTDAAATSLLFSLLSFRRAAVAGNFFLLPSLRWTVDYFTVSGAVSCFRIVLYTI